MKQTEFLHFLMRRHAVIIRLTKKGMSWGVRFLRWQHSLDESGLSGLFSFRFDRFSAIPVDWREAPLVILAMRYSPIFERGVEITIINFVFRFFPGMKRIPFHDSAMKSILRNRETGRCSNFDFIIQRHSIKEAWAEDLKDNWMGEIWEAAFFTWFFLFILLELTNPSLFSTDD